MSSDEGVSKFQVLSGICKLVCRHDFILSFGDKQKKAKQKDIFCIYDKASQIQLNSGSLRLARHYPHFAGLVDISCNVPVPAAAQQTIPPHRSQV